LEIKNLSHGAMTGRMLEKIEAVLQKENPRIVMVYGDTNTTLAGALAAAKLHIPVAHVEAGLRSFNRHMPEEINRVLTDHLAQTLLCPTRRAVENLLIEGIGVERPSVFGAPCGFKQQVELAGDVMLDAALHYRGFAREPNFDLPPEFIVATIHRAENTDDSARLTSLFDGLQRVGKELPVLIPLHPRTRKLMEAFGLRPDSACVRIVEPLGYLSMIYLLERCRLVMTDSGGLQKEAVFFRKPCITLRDETEWVELVENGFNVLAGANSGRIYSAFRAMMERSLNFDNDLYGDGRAGQKIVKILVEVSLTERTETQRLQSKANGAKHGVRGIRSR
jgi:UDP-GlcNAc3NAcA epimerase